MCEEIVRKLHELGETSSEIAASLTALGIKGRHSSHMHCPLANYLKPFSKVYVWVRGTYLEIDNQIIKYTPELSLFIYHFDTGCYPSLEECDYVA